MGDNRAEIQLLDSGLESILHRPMPVGNVAVGMQITPVEVVTVV